MGGEVAHKSVNCQKKHWKGHPKPQMAEKWPRVATPHGKPHPHASVGVLLAFCHGCYLLPRYGTDYAVVTLQGYRYWYRYPCYAGNRQHWWGHSTFF